jgi:hypothetical protein
VSKNFSSSLLACLSFRIMISEKSSAPYLYTPVGSGLDYFNLRYHTRVLYVSEIIFSDSCSSIPHTNATSNDSLEFCSTAPIWCWIMSIISSITYDMHDVSEIVATPVFTWLLVVMSTNILLHTALIRIRNIAMRKFETCLLISSTTSGTKRLLLCPLKPFSFSNINSFERCLI